MANVKVRDNVAAGNHTVVITALYDKNAASSGYYFYFDYLWPLVPQDVPDAPKGFVEIRSLKFRFTGVGRFADHFHVFNIGSTPV